MIKNREYEHFEFKDAVLRICAAPSRPVKDEIIKQRRILEEYIQLQPKFQSAFSPVTLLPDAPLVAKRMADAATKTGLGPMAAVAGTMSQLAAEAALKAGSPEAIVENGGDIFAQVRYPLIIGLLTGATPIADRLAFYLEPQESPIAICASSGTMGHSTSLGQCDLAVAVSDNAALADAAATMAANLVTTPETLEPAVNKVNGIPGISGVFLVKSEQIAMAGQLPKLIKLS